MLKDRKGFTLIELLVVVAIIGILAAIAIPQFAEYRKRGFDARAQADLRNAATAEEAYFATNQDYTDATCATAGACTALPGASVSDGVTVTMTKEGTGFKGTATHADAGKNWEYHSSTGLMTGTAK